ncbi:hypothetical protein Kisp01_64080 [Kineosporia sp. NBRC 101677]|uniref:DUF72 domain-containing protein n=1 Tax=Kineosporia sp. NBRC 101677 TaxID=3032197 RepID=UPI0024A05778|nr:DUF72 domain-containing protein [Kineosporia sp. NBRC 101677]GLY19394.1 hypothetical protein Kisp01_64080 [Kineosporia sp. NBRC 101677]
MADVRIGISGWRYPPWRGTFYPKGLTQARELEYAAQRLNSIEINGSFYSLQRPSSYRQWAAQTPDDFVFTLKGSRFITHMKRLKDIDTPLATFLASGVLALGPKLGPMLWQLPPTMPYERDVLGPFLDKLPTSTTQAARLARGHDGKLKEDRVLLEPDADRPIRHALEVRHPSFADADLVQLLQDHNVALVIADSAGKFPVLEDVTADFVYVRLHGEEELYVSGYDTASLDRWADRVRQWHSGRIRRTPNTITTLPPSRAARDVFVYFDNDAKVHAPYDAMSLAERLVV